LSGRHVPEPRRTPQQHAASFGREDRAIADLRGKPKRNELFDNESIEDPALCRRRAERFQRFLLIRREIVVDFRVHAASKTSGFRRCLTEAA
jgi:hypothetical protein